MHELTKVRGQYWGNLDNSWTSRLAEHKQFLVEECFRSIHYLIAICIREARHARGLEDPRFLINRGLFPKAEYQHFTKAQEQASDHLLNLHSALKDDGFFNMDTVQVTHYVLNTFPQQYTLFDVMTYVRILFDEASWDSSYGGEAWSDLAKAALEVVSGKRTLYEGLDNAFSLVHNNGSIFNKGFFYRTEYSEKFGMKFLLDCQRSGQLVNAILEGYFINAMFSEHSAAAQHAFCKGTKPKGVDILSQNTGLYPLAIELAELNPEYKKPVSFLKLKADGALGDYKTEINAEVNVVENSPQALAAYHTYFQGNQNESFVATKSALLCDPTKPTITELPMNTNVEHKKYGVTPIQLYLGKNGLGEHTEESTLETFPALKPLQLLTRLT